MKIYKSTAKICRSKFVILCLSSIWLTISGCKKDLLDTIPKTSVLTSNMWNTDNLTDLGVNGVYATLKNGQNLYKYDQYHLLLSRDNSSLLNGTVTTSNGTFSSEWQNLFDGVHVANNAIFGLLNYSPTVADKKSRLVAEVKFLRAFFYYRLNQLFQGVPIYTEPIAYNGAVKPRNTVTEVWDQVIADLTDCIEEPNLPNRYQAADANYGRVGKSAAYALRGKVYMYTQQWELAIADFEQVKDLGHSLFANYAGLFLDINEQNSENIFTIQNIALAGYGNDYQLSFGSRSAFGSNWNTFWVNPDAVDLYENIDGSPFHWDDYLPGYNAMPTDQREVFFLRNNLSAADVVNMRNKGLDMSLYLPTGNEERLKKAYENRDPRLASNVILPYSTFLGNNNGTDQLFTNRWPFKQEFAGIFDIRTDLTSRYFYMPRKFVYTGAKPAIPDRSSGAYDHIVIRYADILLSWAEALNEINNMSEAVAKVNEVRLRAGVALLNSSANTQVSHKLDLLKRIQNEKRKELICEGTSFFDELRWKTWKEEVFYEGNGVKQVWGSVLSPYVWAGDQMYIWAIPQVERERNTSLTQNPGWNN